ncbi:amidohydrolase [Actinocatenispora comari]|uniref:Amidohydrolase n=1 Tax=Actinocatenispora comari TaxID=2807577 RepID=A0A8J4ELA8_9ACTN|nr:amidohydrolase family protein [Actinocatenispora comari]GIL25404.1 amidohydrolase [Actinocatenispora comari]
MTDTIFRNARVRTVDDGFSVAESFAVHGDRITAVGSEREVAAGAAAGARIIDLRGATVLPGFIDTHAHAVHRALAALAVPSLVGAGSVAEIARRIGAAAQRSAPGAWIAATSIGTPPDHFDLPEGLAERRWPTRHDLDAAAPDNPVLIPTPAYWPHPAILNSAALAALGIDRDTADADGIRFERDGTGAPTGLVHGLHFYNGRAPLFGRMMRLLPRPSAPARQAAIAAELAANVAAGITTSYEGHVNMATDDLRALHEAGALPGRVFASYEVPVGHPDPAAWLDSVADARGAGTGDDVLRVAGVTVSMEAPVQFGGALMHRPYRDAHGRLTNGTMALDVDALVELGRLAAARDVRLNVLAAGDLACARTVDALSTVDKEFSLAGRHWIVQHFPHPTPDQIDRLVAMGVAAQTYAGTDYGKGAATYVDGLGGELWRDLVPLRWWLDGGAVIAQGSDGAHAEAMWQLWQTLRRVDGRTGRSLLTPAKTVTRPEAVRTWTVNGAILLDAADRLGSLEPGRLADFMVLDADPLTCPVDEIRDITVTGTVVGGVTVHGDLG